MLSNYGYGLTDNSPNTPWNEVEVPEREFDVVISQSLSKGTSIYTQNYIPEFDEEGGYTYADTSDTNWADEYKKNGHYTPLQLIAVLKKYVEAELESMVEEPTENNEKFYWIIRKRKLKGLLEECEGWQEDELEVIEE